MPLILNDFLKTYLLLYFYFYEFWKWKDISNININVIAYKFHDFKENHFYTIKVSLLIHLRTLKGISLNIYDSYTPSWVLYMCDMICHFHPSNMSEKFLFEEFVVNLWSLNFLISYVTSIQQSKQKVHSLKKWKESIYET